MKLRLLPGEVRYERTGLVFLLAQVLVVISFVTRALLTLKSFTAIDFGVANVLGIFFIGLAYDLVNAVYFVCPLVLYLWNIPQRFYAIRASVYGLYVLLYILIFIFILLFNGVAEWLFWDEFNTRFNFIAVDYLIYTTTSLLFFPPRPKSKPSAFPPDSNLPRPK